VAEIPQLSNTLSFGGAAGGDISDETAASPTPPVTLHVGFSSEGGWRLERAAAPSPSSPRMRPLARALIWAPRRRREQGAPAVEALEGGRGKKVRDRARGDWAKTVAYSVGR
jgi:hypothetical protein